MNPSPGRFALLVLLMVVGVGALSALIAAAGHGVAVAVAVTTLALLVAAYLGTGLLMLRSLRHPRAREMVRRWGRVPVAVMVATPLILFAARPWGVATLVVGAGAMVGCQFFLHAMIIVMAIRSRGRRGPETAPTPAD